MAEQTPSPVFARGNSARTFALLLLACVSGSGGALDFMPSPGKAEWKIKASSLECRLTQAIPYFGEATFRQGAGEAAQFRLSSNQRIWPGDARLSVEAPPWRTPIEPISLGAVPVRAGSTPIQLSGELADKLLSALFEGLSPVFGGIPSSTLRGTTSVGLAAVNFRPAYSDFRSCQAKLLPYSYADVQRTRIGYEGGGFELDSSARNRLDVLLEHMRLAKDVTAIFVDGYTDDTGRRTANLELSKKRAEAVTNYLLGHGIVKEMITMRYHGSRYPVARGQSASARAQNRRVTVRVERG